MNGVARTPRRALATGRIWSAVILTLMAVVVMTANRAHAAAIVHSDKTEKIDKADFTTWSEYLMGGPSVWAAVPHPPVTETVRREIRHALKTDPGGTAPVVQFLLWKQSLDPARFDHYHPNLVGPLARIAAEIPAVSTPTTTGAQVLTPQSTGSGRPSTSTTTSPSLPTEPQTTTGGAPEAAVPEPSTILLAIGLGGWAVYWRRRQS